MRTQTIGQVMHRIRAAKESSPIAVFRNDKGELNAKLANTALTQKEIRENKNYVGTFSEKDKNDDVFEVLRKAQLSNKNLPAWIG